MSKRTKYFAFGSNMFSNRMLQRVPSAKIIGIARLDDHCLAFRKRGVDGTGKADIEPAEGESVWGILYSMNKDERAKLDRYEGGYDRVSVTVATASGPVKAFTYQAKEQSFLLALPSEWYRDIILAGALEHGLPGPYAALLAKVPAQGDSGGA